MVDRYYIDSSIYRDFHEGRSDRFRPLGEWAFELFRLIKETKSKILYSGLIIDELSTAYDKETISKIFDIFRDEGLLEKVEMKQEQFKEAAKLKKKLNIPFADCLHAIIARDNKAIMVARDKHFYELQNSTESKKPEDLI